MERKRILSLDGGGVRGVFTIEILARMEELLREKYKNEKPDFVLADHFQFMAGTSTGAILATLLSWGQTVDQVRTLYYERCQEIFPPFAPWRVWRFRRLWHRLARAIYGEESLADFLQDFFKDKVTGKPVDLGTDQLKTLLLLCMRNASTGSAWPVTNNKSALYNQPDDPACNLRLPLWQLVRASTAAPIYFLPEKIKVGDAEFAFIDGGMTPYNNPALIAALTAILPCYHIEWPTGPDKLLLVSIGTGRMRSVLKDLSFWTLNMGKNLLTVPQGLMESASMQQDFLCRVFGHCIFGDQIDTEVGDLIPAGQDLNLSGDKKFSYVRYDHSFGGQELIDAVAAVGELTLSNIKSMPLLTQLGQTYALKNVKLKHLL